jgi:ABC-type Fe3+ transport system permease subunit
VRYDIYIYIYVIRRQRVKKELSYTSTHPMGLPGPVTGLLYLYLYHPLVSA